RSRTQRRRRPRRKTCWISSSFPPHVHPIGHDGRSEPTAGSPGVSRMIQVLRGPALLTRDELLEDRLAQKPRRKETLGEDEVVVFAAVEPVTQGALGGGADLEQPRVAAEIG